MTEDFYKDGLLYCGKCNTPKQSRFQNPFDPDKIDIQTHLCECETAERDERKKTFEVNSFRIDYEHILRGYRVDGYPREFFNAYKIKDSENYITAKRAEMQMQEYKRICFAEDNRKMLGWTFENADPESGAVIEAAKNYVADFENMMKEGKGLLFFGKVGTGKTYAAACIANALIEKGYAALLTDFATISRTAQGMYHGKQEYYDSFNRFPLLILDDLTTERNTEFMDEVVFSVINSRSNSGLPLIVTTNLTAEELKKPSEIKRQRIFSRLLERCHPVNATGKDKRLEQMKEGFLPMKERLGL